MSVVGCAAALVIMAETRRRRSEVLVFSFKVFAIAALSYVLIALTVGMPLSNLSDYFISFVDAGAKPIAMSLLGIITFGGTVYLLAILSLAQRSDKKWWFLMWWFVLSTLPHAIITQKYMIEPRYLVSGLVPLAGLGGIGLVGLWKVVSGWRFRYVMAVGLLLFTISLNAVIVRLMPYELDGRALLEAVDRILQSDSRASVLVPWAYSDFHFLRVMRPEAQVFNVNTPTTQDGVSVLDEGWRFRLKHFYGDRYLAAPEDVNQILKSGPVYYLSWGKYPPLGKRQPICQAAWVGGRRKFT